MNDSINGAIQGKCPWCGWERKIASLTPATETIFCKRCPFQGDFDLWRANAQAQADKLPSNSKELSDSELLHKIAKHSEESAFVLKRFLLVTQCFAALWILDKVLFIFFS